MVTRVVYGIASSLCLKFAIDSANSLGPLVSLNAAGQLRRETSAARGSVREGEFDRGMGRDLLNAISLDNGLLFQVNRAVKAFALTSSRGCLRWFMTMVSGSIPKP